METPSVVAPTDGAEVAGTTTGVGRPFVPVEIEVMEDAAPVGGIVLGKTTGVGRPFEPVVVVVNDPVGLDTGTTTGVVCPSAPVLIEVLN